MCFQPSVDFGFRGVTDRTERRAAVAHIAMDESLRNIIDKGIASPQIAVKLASRNPAVALGIDADLGQVKEGLRASLSLFDRNFNATAVIRLAAFS